METYIIIYFIVLIIDLLFSILFYNTKGTGWDDKTLSGAIMLSFLPILNIVYLLMIIIASTYGAIVVFSKRNRIK